MRLRLLLAAVVLLAPAACLVGPNYQRPPTTPVQPEWRGGNDSLGDFSYANLPWWEILGDTTLQRLVRIALRENRDLYIALAHVNESRALLGIQRFESYPQIDVRASRRTANGADSAISGTGQRNVAFIEAEVSWELDLWGRLRRLDEAARATLLASEFARRGVIITVVSDVARAYLEL